jgi:antitoxin CcdA
MLATFDTLAPKKPTNVSINTDLLKRAKDMEINLSATLEKALVAEVRKRRGEQWLKNNAEAIREHNAFIEKHGCFSDGLRSF